MAQSFYFLSIIHPDQTVEWVNMAQVESVHVSAPPDRDKVTLFLTSGRQIEVPEGNTVDLLFDFLEGKNVEYSDRDGNKADQAHSS